MQPSLPSSRRAAQHYRPAFFGREPRGQALVLITLAAVGLFAFAALAIDGTSVFSDRRHSQNASDTSALAAALVIARNPTGNWTQAARDRASSNGYNEADGVTKVYVHLCNDTSVVTDEGIHLTCQGLPQNADPKEYVHVYIKSVVKLFFARVIGRQTAINHTEAIAHGSPFSRKTTFSGHSLVALTQHDCKALQYNGGSATTITGTGIFVNSDCDPNENQSLGAFNTNTGAGTFSAPCLNVVGGVETGTGTTLDTGSGCMDVHPGGSSMQITDPWSQIPTIKDPCGTKVGSYDSGTKTFSPGNFSGAFPPNSAASDAILSPGVYCLDTQNAGFSLQAGATLTGNGVFIYMKSGDVKWTSGGIHLSAMQGVNPLYDGLLIYTDKDNYCPHTTNGYGISITGNGSSTFVGTIMAPCSTVSAAGSSNSGTVSVLENQIIGYNIELSGGSGLQIHFNAGQQWQPPVYPEIQMTK